MIKHIVMWKLKDGVAPADARLAQAAADLGALVGVVPGLRDLEFGTDFSGLAFSWDVALTSSFDSREDLANYQVHPDHVAIAAVLGELFADKALVDFEC